MVRPLRLELRSPSLVGRCSIRFELRAHTGDRGTPQTFPCSFHSIKSAFQLADVISASIVIFFTSLPALTTAAEDPRFIPVIFRTHNFLGAIVRVLCNENCPFTCGVTASHKSLLPPTISAAILFMNGASPCKRSMLAAVDL